MYSGRYIDRNRIPSQPNGHQGGSGGPDGDLGEVLGCSGTGESCLGGEVGWVSAVVSVSGELEVATSASVSVSAADWTLSLAIAGFATTNTGRWRSDINGSGELSGR